MKCGCPTVRVIFPQPVDGRPRALDLGECATVPIHDIPIGDVLQDMYDAIGEAFKRNGHQPSIIVLGWRNALRFVHITRCPGMAKQMAGIHTAPFPPPPGWPSNRFPVSFSFLHDVDIRLLDDPERPDFIATIPDVGTDVAFHAAALGAEYMDRRKNPVPTPYVYDGLTEEWKRDQTPQRAQPTVTQSTTKIDYPKPVTCPACLTPITTLQALGLERHDCPNTRKRP